MNKTKKRRVVAYTIRIINMWTAYISARRFTLLPIIGELVVKNSGDWYLAFCWLVWEVRVRSEIDTREVDIPIDVHRIKGKMLREVSRRGGLTVDYYSNKYHIPRSQVEEMAASLDITIEEDKLYVIK